MWDQVKQASPREVCGSVGLDGNPESMWWNNQVKAAVKRKEVFGARDEER